MAEKKTIELIPKEIEAAKAQEKFLARLKAVGRGALGVGVGFSILFWGGVLAQTARLNFLEGESNKTIEQISKFADTERTVLGLAAKSAGIAKIFTERDYFSVLLSAVKVSTPIGVTVTGLSAVKDKALVTISGETLSYNELATFLKNLVDPTKGGTLFTEATLNSVTLDSATGKASFVVELVMKRDGLKKPLGSGVK